MINCIKLVIIYHLNKMGKLHCNNASVCQNDLHSPNKIHNIRNVGQHIVTQ